MSPILRKYSRHIHLWGALCIVIPSVIVIGSGLLLQVKKEFDWIQPPTQKLEKRAPSLHFDDIMTIVSGIPDIDINEWKDIDRLDVRPSKGIIKVRGKNQWEVQLDGQTGEVLQVAYRRTDTIEAIHDGSWFFEGAKLWVFLPAAIVLLAIWLTGLVMLYTTLKSKFRRKQVRATRQ